MRVQLLPDRRVEYSYDGDSDLGRCDRLHDATDVSEHQFECLVGLAIHESAIEMACQYVACDLQQVAKIVVGLVFEVGETDAVHDDLSLLAVINSIVLSVFECNQLLQTGVHKRVRLEVV